MFLTDDDDKSWVLLAVSGAEAAFSMTKYSLGEHEPSPYRCGGNKIAVTMMKMIGGPSNREKGGKEEPTWFLSITGVGRRTLSEEFCSTAQKATDL